MARCYHLTEQSHMFQQEGKTHSCFCWKMEDGRTKLGYKLTAVWLAVVDFIQWYNTQPKPQS